MAASSARCLRRFPDKIYDPVEAEQLLNDSRALYKLAGRLNKNPRKLRNLFSLLAGELLQELNKFWVHAEYPSITFVGRIFANISDPRTWAITTCVRHQYRLGGHRLGMKIDDYENDLVWKFKKDSLSYHTGLRKSHCKRKTSEPGGEKWSPDQCCRNYWSDHIFHGIRALPGEYSVWEGGVELQEVRLDLMPTFRMQIDGRCDKLTMRMYYEN